MTYQLSGNNLIDALIKTNDYAPPRNSAPGTSITVYYTFDNTSGYGHTALSAAQQAVVNRVIAEYEAAAGIDFIAGYRPGTTSSDIGFYVAGAGSGGQYAPAALGIRLENGNQVLGYVEVNSNHLSNFEFLVRHELGHGLGLDHPANYTGFESAPHLDTNAIQSFSVMGYGDDGSNTLTINDINALRYMYGLPLSSSGSSGNQLTSGNDSYSGTTGNDVVSGLAGNDLLSGNAGNDLLAGNQGADTINGNDGNDTVQGGQDNDSLNGNSGNDSMQGGMGNDTISGGTGNDIMRAGQGSDQLLGNEGADTMYGGLGNDQLTGGDGADIFVFNTDSDVDTIQDFQNGTDKIQIVGLGVSSFQDLLPYISSSGGNTLLSADGDSLTLVGVSSNLLDASDFIFG